MHAGRPTFQVVLTVKERYTLMRWARRRRTRRALAQRARIVLACAAGKTNCSIGITAGVTRQTVGRWRRRFVHGRLQGLLDVPRPGAPRKITDAQVERVVRLTRAAATRRHMRWSTRAMARRCGLSQTAVCRIWRAWRRQ
ncbi:MAG TPA: helix-turn-helix domain-containing protein [Methylomirabilota bacterium]|nr:helix-turn-helix domain-containing protein [Methylomirabilota bacterium]